MLTGFFDIYSSHYLLYINQSVREGEGEFEVNARVCAADAAPPFAVDRRLVEQFP